MFPTRLTDLRKLCGQFTTTSVEVKNEFRELDILPSPGHYLSLCFILFLFLKIRTKRIFGKRSSSTAIHHRKTALYCSNRIFYPSEITSRSCVITFGIYVFVPLSGSAYIFPCIYFQKNFFTSLLKISLP